MKELETAVNKKLATGAATPKPVATTPSNSAAKQPAKPVSQSGNDNIRAFQKWMNSTYGWAMAEDGISGPDTRKHAVMALQTELNKQFGKGLAVDGAFGNKTYAACVSVKENARGNITRIIQGMLYCKGYDPHGFDGIFGAGCAKAVRAFQTNNGLTPDAVAGKNTFRKLMA